MLKDVLKFTLLQAAPKIRVHIVTEGKHRKEVFWRWRITTLLCVLLDWLLLVIFEILEYIKYWILDLIQYNDFLVGPQRFAQVVFQTRAPVKSVVYDTPYARANQYSIDTVVDLYR